MSTRTGRLDEETEQVLQQIVRVTGLSVSAALKKGLVALQSEIAERSQPVPYDIYQELDLGPGDYAIASSSSHTRRSARSHQKKIKAMILVDTGPVVALLLCLIHGIFNMSTANVSVNHSEK